MRQPTQAAVDAHTDVPAGSRRDRRREEVRGRILTAAFDLFAQQGYAGTSFDEIAARADLARRTVFNHFPRKRDILAVWADQRRVMLSDLLADELVQKASAPRQLELQLHALALANERDPQLARVLSMGWLSEMGTLETPFPLFDGFSASVQLGQDRGEFTSSPPAELVGEIIAACYTDTLDRWLHSGDTASTWSLSSTLMAKLNVILRGIAIDRP